MIRRRSAVGWINSQVCARPLFSLWLACFCTTAAGAEDRMRLAGLWRFELDPGDAGIRRKWFDTRLAKAIQLPGVLQAQGYGEAVATDTKWTGEIVDRSWFTDPGYARYRRPGHIKIPFWLQPERHYVGAAWYQRQVTIPASWRGKEVVLVLERPHWETRVWLDGRAQGSNNSLSTPHEYLLGRVAPGTHRLTIRVDNRLVIDVGINSHSVTDHTQGNWNGIVGVIELRAVPAVWIDDLRVYPHVSSKSVTVRGRIRNASGAPGRGAVGIEVRRIGAEPTEAAPRRELQVSWDSEGAGFESEYLLGDAARPWDEFSPVLYELAATVGRGEHSKSVAFGLREISTQGTRFVLNGRPVFFRGTLECAIFPLTGHPPTDVESWVRIVRIAKEHGLNNMRFHSWCPPEAAFVAADTLGFYYQVECASWANTSTRLGVGLPIDKWLYDEADRILKAYGNHPSFVLMPYGNEPAGDIQRYLGSWVNHFKTADPRRLYTGGSGWPQIPENQFHVLPEPRIQAWGAGLKSRINARPPETRTDYRDFISARRVPVISHEIGQWCAYPNFDEIPKYRGYLKPKNLEIFRDMLEAHSMGDQARAFLMASGRLQTLCYKEDIESALRTDGMGGFQLLDLHDFPGQGTALVGVLDAFWDSKGYVTPAEFRRFCNSTVPLARLSRRVFTTEEELDADVEVAHFGPQPLRGVVVEARLLGDGPGVLAESRWLPGDLPIGNSAIGTFRAPLARLVAPGHYRLVVGVKGTAFENDWDVWVYPPRVGVEPPEGVMILEMSDAHALERIEAGGTALLVIPPDRVAGDRHGPVATGFSSIFWNTAWTRRQAPHTLGILCDSGHPAFAAFPTESHSNWQWWYVVSRAQAMILDGLPTGIRPIVQVIDDWFTSRRLGLVFEARVGQGRVIVSSIELRGALEGNPVARQLLHSLLSYMRSDRFRPAGVVSAEAIRALGTYR